MQLTDERRNHVIDLYFNQHNTYAEIAQIMKMSPRDIHSIIKEEEARRLQNEHKQQQEETSSKAYELFSKSKRPVEVAIALNLREPETTKLYREYWRLKRLHILNKIYKETNGKLDAFLKLYRLMKEKGMTIEQVVNAVEIAIHKLPYMESLYKQAKEEVDKMQRTVQQLKNYLHNLKEEIASSKELLKSYHMLCERKRQEAEYLNNDISRLENIISQFKNNNEEYLKIKKGVEEEVRIVLTDSKVLLQFALASVVEAIRRNPDKYNNLLRYDLPISGPLSHIEDYKGMILDEVKGLYDRLMKHFTNSIMDNAAGASSSSNTTLSLSSSTLPSPYNQSDTNRTEEP